MKQEQIFGLIRHALTIVGGALIAKGYIDSDGIEEVYGSVMALVGVVWSYIDKNKKSITT